MILGIIRGILGVITILSIMLTLTKLGKPIPMQTTMILVVLAFFLLALCPKLIGRIIRYIAIAITAYALIVYLDGVNALFALAPLLLMFIGCYIMLRPLMRKK